MTQPTAAILGAGQAGFQAAASLRDLDYAGRILLIGDEPHAPYRRPPLSKAYLLGEAVEAQISLCPPAFAAQRGVELVTGKRAVAIEREHRRLRFEDASLVEYDQLILATGARNRLLRVPGADLANVFFLRTRDEAERLRTRMASARRAVVVGAGFIGLEFAACAAKQGLEVTVLEVAERPMARAVSTIMSAIFAREHGKLGVRLCCNCQVTTLLGEDGRVSAVETADRRVFPADLVVIGIGVTPNVEIAAACGLAVEDGIVVDEFLQTSDAQISAIGDVAAHVNHYAGGQRVRLESVQNACDQARCVAQRLVGRPSAYHALPWFWSHQADLKLQLAGLPRPGCKEVVRGDTTGTNCAVFLFHEDRLVCVETLNRAGDHMLARRLLTSRVAVTPEQAADPSFDLKSLLTSPASVRRDAAVATETA